MESQRKHLKQKHIESDFQHQIDTEKALAAPKIVIMLQKKEDSSISSDDQTKYQAGVSNL
jgi:hypothetical protein